MRITGQDYLSHPESYLIERASLVPQGQAFQPQAIDRALRFPSSCLRCSKQPIYPSSGLPSTPQVVGLRVPVTAAFILAPCGTVSAWRHEARECEPEGQRAQGREATRQALTRGVSSTGAAGGVGPRATETIDLARSGLRLRAEGVRTFFTA
jgi:hypothetical protein